MSTIRIHQTMALTPEQYITGLTDFGPGRSDVFSKSADDYVKVHSVGSTEADGYTCTFTRLPEEAPVEHAAAVRAALGGGHGT